MTTIEVWLADLDCPAAGRQRLVADTILRLELGRRLGCPPAAVRIERGAEGKPQLAPGQPKLHFSLSHSHGRALIALSADREVGVDLEPLDPDRPIERLAARRFTAREHAFIRDAADHNQRTERFYRLWAAKEACVKATGEGIAALQRVELSPELVRASWDEPRLGASEWRVQELALGPGWAAAVAAPGTDWRAQLRRWRLARD